MRTANPSGGYYGTMAAYYGRESAENAYECAFKYLSQFLVDKGVKFEPVEVRNYLDSAYGRHTATSSLGGEPIHRQLEFRPGRCLRHFKAIQKRTAAGEFGTADGTPVKA